MLQIMILYQLYLREIMAIFLCLWCQSLLCSRCYRFIFLAWGQRISQVLSADLHGHGNFSAVIDLGPRAWAPSWANR